MAIDLALHAGTGSSRRRGWGLFRGLLPFQFGPMLFIPINPTLLCQSRVVSFLFYSESYCEHRCLLPCWSICSHNITTYSVLKAQLLPLKCQSSWTMSPVNGADKTAVASFRRHMDFAPCSILQIFIFTEINYIQHGRSPLALGMMCCTIRTYSVDVEICIRYLDYEIIHLIHSDALLRIYRCLVLP